MTETISAYLARIRRDEIDSRIDELDRELDTFQWAQPDRGQANLGELSVDHDTRELVLSLLRFDSEDVEMGELIPFVARTPVTTAPAREQVRDFIHTAICHEADEQMWFGNERPFYPHTTQEA